MKAKVGVYVCECGPNIAGKTDLDEIITYLSEFRGFGDVELVVRKYGFLCSNQGKEYLEKEIRDLGLTHLVVGACSPRDHDSTFKDVCGKTQLNPYLYKIINIREHCTWVIDDMDKATEKAKSYLRAGIARVLYQSELFESPIDVNPDVLVIGGGVAGMEAALALAGENRSVTIVEKNDTLGGRAGKLRGFSFQEFNKPEQVEKLIETILGNPCINVFLDSEVTSVIGFLGNFEIEHVSLESKVITELFCGSIITATGADLYETTEESGFKYSESDDVYNSMEITEMLSSGDEITLRSGKEPETIAIVHCVGREELGYCSGVCCTVMMKTANMIKARYPDIRITQFYRDICLPPSGGQELYAAARSSGVNFVKVQSTGLSGTTVKFKEKNGDEGEQFFDMVLLASALVPSKDTPALSELLGIPVDETGFFQEAHRMTNPSATTTDGVFIVGTSQGPRNISDSMLFARASAGQILTKLLVGEKLVPEVAVTEILEAYCTGCGNCLDVCVYGAIYPDEARGISIVNEAICRGCGNCYGSCPSGALRTKHFTNIQLFREVDEALR
ncbi:MAG: CoB--CoM heterodisulfide reductase iron-sulfur subunit A family protein [Candidatus Sabulitectum sp.]|nr:CoB--CoM heterodisulfide reductase iron-sulfur subunit A family protein [Candidatus Sabulitectum sp.]